MISRYKDYGSSDCTEELVRLLLFLLFDVIFFLMDYNVVFIMLNFMVKFWSNCDVHCLFLRL